MAINGRGATVNKLIRNVSLPPSRSGSRQIETDPVLPVGFVKTCRPLGEHTATGGRLPVARRADLRRSSAGGRLHRPADQIERVPAARSGDVRAVRMCGHRDGLRRCGGVRRTGNPASARDALRAVDGLSLGQPGGGEFSPAGVAQNRSSSWAISPIDSELVVGLPSVARAVPRLGHTDQPAVTPCTTIWSAKDGT